MIKNIELNFNRLNEKEYQIENVFQDNDIYDWPGDWEGRALLGFCCHYEINKKKTPALEVFIDELEKHYNNGKYIGKEYDGKVIDEQQLSGHNWYLRGLLKYYDLFKDKRALDIATSTIENLYLPIMDKYKDYPLDREEIGGVSGHSGNIINGWKVSSDVGCAFMFVDGLSRYHKLTHDERVKKCLDVMINKFSSIDIVKNKFQTHTSLSCMRGILSLYETTKDEKYLNDVIRLFDIYINNGMTLTYENFNWFNRFDTWTEPCAVIDSFILATHLYNITSKKEYLTLARRIWFNGLQFCQRINGGAGPNSCVTKDNPVLKISMYEATFCCSMRYAEGLLVYSKYEHLFSWNKDAKQIKESDGRRYIDDKLLVKYNDEIVPIFSCNTIKKEEAEKINLEIIF